MIVLPKPYDSLKNFVERIIADTKRKFPVCDEPEFAVKVAKRIANEAVLNLDGGAFSKLSILPVMVTIVATRDHFILNIYTEVEEENEQGIYGFGLAYNITDPDLSEIGYLFTPRSIPSDACDEDLDDFEGGDD